MKLTLYKMAGNGLVNDQCESFHCGFNCSLDQYQQAKCAFRGGFTHGMVHTLSSQLSLLRVLLLCVSETCRHMRQSIFSAFNLHLFGNQNFQNEPSRLL